MFDQNQPSLTAATITHSTLVAKEAPFGTGRNRPEHAQIKSFLIKEVSELMMIPRASVDSNTRLEDLGMDSQDSLELIGVLEDWLGHRLRQTLVAEHGSIEAIATQISGGNNNK